MTDEPKITVTLPTGGNAQGVPVQVDESSEKWSEFTLRDGTVVRGKISITSAVRVDGQYDPQGNPVYLFNITPVLVVAKTVDALRGEKN